MRSAGRPGSTPLLCRSEPLGQCVFLINADEFVELGKRHQSLRLAPVVPSSFKIRYTDSMIRAEANRAVSG